MTSAKQWLLAGFALLCVYGAVESKRNFKCPSGCSCSKETIVCVGTSQIPRTIPNEINSLWVINHISSDDDYLFNKAQGNQCCIQGHILLAILCLSAELALGVCLVQSVNMSPSDFDLYVSPNRSMVNGSISEITEGMFSLMPSLQLL